MIDQVYETYGLIGVIYGDVGAVIVVVCLVLLLAQLIDRIFFHGWPK
jgi:hypothetical protein